MAGSGPGATKEHGPSAQCLWRNAAPGPPENIFAAAAALLVSRISIKDILLPQPCSSAKSLATRPFSIFDMGSWKDSVQTEYRIRMNASSGDVVPVNEIFAGWCLAGSGEQQRDWHFECRCQPVDAFERDISRAAFDVRNVSPVQTGPASQFFLRDTQIIAAGSDRSAKLFFYINLTHKMDPDFTR